MKRPLKITMVCRQYVYNIPSRTVPVTISPKYEGLCATSFCLEVCWELKSWQLACTHTQRNLIRRLHTARL